jgi:hypothetical protein
MVVEARRRRLNKSATWTMPNVRCRRPCSRTCNACGACVTPRPALSRKPSTRTGAAIRLRAVGALDCLGARPHPAASAALIDLQAADPPTLASLVDRVVDLERLDTRWAQAMLRHFGDGSADPQSGFAHRLGSRAETLWTMRNGYAMFSPDGIRVMSGHIQSLHEDQRDPLRQRLKIGMHWDVEVTDGTVAPGPLVSQAFCSALPVSYHHFHGARSADWEPLATLVLEAAYEATLWAAVVNAQRGGSRKVLLSALGGGAFGNDERWILAAMQRALRVVQGHGLEIAVVSVRSPSPELQQWARAQVQRAA